MTSGNDIKYGLAGVDIGETAITDLDGPNGRLTHRGHPIGDLVDQKYEDVAYLLVEGSWPNERESAAFCEEIDRFRTIPADLLPIIERLRDRPPGTVLNTCISYLAGNEAFPAKGLIALGPSILAHHSALRSGADVLPPDYELGIPADCLRRIKGGQIDETQARAINADFILHIDHGCNASTFSARVAAGDGCSTMNAIVAAINTFYGARHGGALVDIIDTLDTIASSDPEEVSALVQKSFRERRPVAGFGHRVYRTVDPRASVFLDIAQELSAKTDDDILQKALALVEAMEPYKKFGMHPNVDLYAAVAYRLLGLPRDMFTPMFAVARISGWLAQIAEERVDKMKIKPVLAYVDELEPAS